MEESFTKAREMQFPRSILVGHDTLAQCAEVSADLGFFGRGAIITGEKSNASAGNAVQDFMTEGGYDVDTIVTGAATMANVEEIVARVMEEGYGFLLAVGGGSKIDITKMVASRTRVPFISVPTTASHDGIASGRASLKSDLGPKSVQAVAPMGIIADTGVISRAPYRYLAAGCADVISNLTALMDWEFARRLRNEFFSSTAYYLSKHSAEAIIENAEFIKPDIEESVWTVIKPIIISGTSMSIAGNSRPTSGSEHMFSHALDILYPDRALHGEQCGVGTIMMTYLHGGDWMRIRKALKDIGAPVDAKGINLKEDEVVEALSKMHTIRKDRFTIVGEKGLSPEVARVVAETTLVI
ncbi:MAG: NAD(P)-dependent glycerol-1-phosphate dehydrogenase [Thermoplasmatales archaeon]|nr:NAD(P)-dependent glycerol-1-phosphate dehydrogenase [Thermoplasmatales archaeon]